MNIAVFGLGYVGSVSAACLASDGHRVVGVDPNESKVSLINGGHAPIVEPGLEALVEAAVGDGQLSATVDAAEAVRACEISMICVGTPSQPNGALDLRFVRQVCTDIGRALADVSDHHVVVVRSTMVPGTGADLVIPTLEATSGKKVGHDFGVAVNPEFLREGTAVADYREPPKTVFGATDDRTADVLTSLYGHLDAPLLRTELAVAEMAKYTDNTWHAIKVGFANEIGAVCKALAIDSHAVMDIFLRDTKLNVSSAYLRPGFAFGGSCLPKDVRALTYHARQLDLELPLLSSVLSSNERHIARAVDMIVGTGNRRIGVLGFSFKPGTDDLRESPVVELVERLHGKGYDIRLYDRNVQLARLVGANREYILHHVPHVAKLMVESPDQVIEHADTLLVGNRDPEFAEVVKRRRPGTQVVDLVRIVDGAASENGYSGICW